MIEEHNFFLLWKKYIMILSFWHVGRVRALEECRMSAGPHLPCLDTWLLFHISFHGFLPVIYFLHLFTFSNVEYLFLKYFHIAYITTSSHTFSWFLQNISSGNTFHVLSTRLFLSQDLSTFPSRRSHLYIHVSISLEEFS